MYLSIDTYLLTCLPIDLSIYLQNERATVKDSFDMHSERMHHIRLQLIFPSREREGEGERERARTCERVREGD